MHSSQQPLSDVEAFAQGYEDFLQAPLQVCGRVGSSSIIMSYYFKKSYLTLWSHGRQPLMDNLESQIYETFEKDPIKYKQYRLV